MSALLREDGHRRALDPALAAGILIVIGYGLAGRLLPELVDAERSVRAGPRLDQPLTYWNAMGALAAMGAILAASVAADWTRARVVRAAAAAALPALALGLYLSFSRGALAALAVGVLALALLGGARKVSGSVLIGLVTGGLAIALVTRFPAVENLSGDGGSGQGIAMLAILLALTAAAGLAQAYLVSAEAAGRPQLGRGQARAVAAVVLAAACVAALSTLIPAAGGDSAAASRAQPGADAALPRDRTRLRSLETNRFRYWEVALDAVGDAPLHGLGSAGFATLWLERRTIDEGVRDAHSIYIESLVELGIVGACLLALFLAGAFAAARALRARGLEERDMSAGWLAAGSVFLVHAAVDWDWEMPAVALVFVLLVAATLAARDAGYPERDRAQIGGRGVRAGVRRQRSW